MSDEAKRVKTPRAKWDLLLQIRLSYAELTEIKAASTKLGLDTVPYARSIILRAARGSFL